MRRAYNLEIVDSNDNIVAFWMKIDESTLLTILRTIVPVKGYFMSISVLLGDETEFVPTP